MFRADENCNDYDVDSYPGAPEICEDDVDQNCDGGYSVQFSGFDLMGIAGNGDCNDADPFNLRLRKNARWN